MSRHVRAQLRDAAIAAIMADGAFGKRVYETIIEDRATLSDGPECRLLTTSEVVERASMKDPRTRTITLSVAALARGEDAASTLDELSARIEIALLKSADVEALTIDFQLEGAEIELDGGGAEIVGAVDMTFTAVIVTAPLNPRQKEG